MLAADVQGFLCTAFEANVFYGQFNFTNLQILSHLFSHALVQNQSIRNFYNIIAYLTILVMNILLSRFLNNNYAS